MKSNPNLIITKIVQIILPLLFFLLSYSRVFVSLDPDFGWRIRSGEYFLQNGIPKTDIYTYTTPSFPWVDHAYIQDMVFFLLSQLGDFYLPFLYTLIASLSLFFVFKRQNKYLQDKNYQKYLPAISKKTGAFSSVAFVLSLPVFFMFLSVRAQIVTWLFFSFLLFIIFSEKRFDRYKYFLPFYFLAWANLHGGYFAGLVTLYIYFSVKTFRTKKIIASEWILIVFCTLATLINPYGLANWREIASSVFDSKLRWRISEWLPSVFVFNLPMAAFFAFSSIFIAKFRKKYKLEEIALFAFFLLQAILSRRNLPLFFILSIPFLTKSFYELFNFSKKHEKGKERFKKFYAVVWIVTILIFLFQMSLSFFGFSSLSERVYYPKKAVSYLKNSPPQGELFSLYSWGGYLIWKLPETKVFIDGRMPSWRWRAPEGQLSDPFSYYLDILAGEEDYNLAFERFGVETVLWSPPETREDLRSSLDKYFNKLKAKIKGEAEKDFDFAKTLLEDEAWEEVYRDDKAVILKKK